MRNVKATYKKPTVKASVKRPQIKLKVNAVVNTNVSSIDWGNISGDINDQTDLITILDSKIENEADPIFVSWLSGPPNISSFSNDVGFITLAEVPPETQGLSAVLTINNATGGKNIVFTDGDFSYSENGLVQVTHGNGFYWQAVVDEGPTLGAGQEAYFYIDPYDAEMYVDNVGSIGIFNGGITTGINQAKLTPSFFYVEHSGTIQFNAPVYNFQQGTAGSIVYLNGSKNMVASYMSQLSTGIAYTSGKGISTLTNKLVYDPNANIFYDRTTGLKKIDVDAGQLFNVPAAKLSIDWNARHLVWTDGTTVKLDWSGTSLNVPYATASTVMVFDASKNIVSSGVTTTVLNYLDVTSSVQTQLNSKINTSEISVSVEPYNGASDLNYFLRGDRTWVLRSSDAMPEGSSNLYYTDVRVDARITLQKGAANGLATLGADSKIPSAQLPALAITDTFVVGSQAAMLALSTAETGDIAIRTDLNKTFILSGTYSTLADWKEMLTPTDTVLSVNGQTGVVVLTTTNIAEGTGLYFTDERAQDAVGSILTDTSTIDFTYDDAGNTISAIVIDGSITYAKIQNVATNKLLGRATAGSGVVEEITLTSFGRSLIDDADATAGRATLGLVIGTNVQAYDDDLNTIAGLTATTDNFIVSVASAWASRTPTQVRSTLGLVIGTNVQAWDADLDTIASLTATTNNFIVSVGSAWASRTPAQVRSTLSLVIGTDVQAWDADLDSFAALSGTGTIAYHSAANTWSESSNLTYGSLASGILSGINNNNIVSIFNRTDSADTNQAVLSIRRSRADAAQPGVGFGGSLTYNLEGSVAGTYVQAGSISVTWESAQTNATTQRDASMNFLTMLDNSIAIKWTIDSNGQLINSNTTAATTPLSMTGTANVIAATINPATGNAITTFMTVHKSNSGGSGAAGGGSRIQYTFKNSTNGTDTGGRFDCVISNAVTATFAADFVFQLSAAGAIAERFRIGSAKLTLSDAYDITFNTTTGSKIGTAIGEKFAFHNSTPVVQRAGAAQAAVATTGATNLTPFGFTTAAQADAIVALVNEIRAALVEKGLIKGSA